MESHDRDRLPAHLVELIHHRGQPERARVPEHAKQCDTDSAHHLQEAHGLNSEAAPDVFHQVQQQATSRFGMWPAAIDALHLPQEAGIGLGNSDKRHHG